MRYFGTQAAKSPGRLIRPDLTQTRSGQSEDMNAIDQNLSYHRHADVILDFSGVSFMNSTNISRLLSMLRC